MKKKKPGDRALRLDFMRPALLERRIGAAFLCGLFVAGQKSATRKNQTPLKKKEPRKECSK